MRRFPLIVLLAMPLLASAQIYRYTDANGNVVLTDKPPQDAQAEQVDVRTPNAVKVEPSTLPPELEPFSKENMPAYRVLKIASPVANASVRSNNGDFKVTVRLDPVLRPGHSLQVLLDGSPVGVAGNSPLQLRNIERGTHQLAVMVLDAQQNEVQRSEALTITVQRTADSSDVSLPPDPENPYEPADPDYTPGDPNYDPSKPSFTPGKPNYTPQTPNYKPATPSYSPKATSGS